MGRIKQIKIKNRTYYFYDDTINIKDFDSSLLKLDKKSFKNIGICYIGYTTKKDECKINSVNPFHLIGREIDGFIEGKEGSKYLNITITDSNSEVLKKYAQIWSGIKDQIEQINSDKPGEYGNKIQFR